MREYKNQLRQYREDLNVKRYNEGLEEITQETLAVAAGVSRQAIIAIEAETAMPSYPVAVRIFDFLKKHGAKVDLEVKLLSLFPLPPNRRASERN